MLRRVAFVSLNQAQALAGRPDTLVVSIRDARYTPVLAPGFAAVLPLEFDDHDNDRDGLDALKHKFDAAHAEVLRAWLAARAAAPEAYDLLVHCRAGMSRSAAIAWWVHRQFEVPLTTRFPAYHLNRHVLRTLAPEIAPPPLPADAPSLYAMMVGSERNLPEPEWPWC